MRVTCLASGEVYRPWSLGECFPYYIWLFVMLSGICFMYRNLSVKIGVYLDKLTSQILKFLVIPMMYIACSPGVMALTSLSYLNYSL